MPPMDVPVQRGPLEPNQRSIQLCELKFETNPSSNIRAHIYIKSRLKSNNIIITEFNYWVKYSQNETN